jgi:hypothetical protein
MPVGGSGGRCFTVSEVASEELRKESESIIPEPVSLSDI